MNIFRSVNELACRRDFYITFNESNKVYASFLVLIMINKRKVEEENAICAY